MKHLDGRPPFYAWIHLLGLEIPIASALWAILFCSMLEMQVIPNHLIQFLFVAAWCVVISSRLLKILILPSKIHEDPALEFTKSNCFIFWLITAISIPCGIWAALSQMSVGVISYALLPFLLSLTYLLQSLKRKEEFSAQIAGSLAFALAVPIPASFYALSTNINVPVFFPNPEFLFSAPIWCIAWLFFLAAFCRQAFQDPFSTRIPRNSPLFLAGSLIGFIIFLMNRTGTDDPKFGLYLSIAVGAGWCYFISRIEEKLSWEQFQCLTWCALIIPVPLALFIIKSPF